MKTLDKLLLGGAWILIVVHTFQISTLFKETKTEIEIEENFKSDQVVPDPIPIQISKKKTELQLTAKEKTCLARNIFYEAGVESEKGKLAVAQVTYNRLKSGRWGKNLCSVVHAKAQFSWTLEQKKLNGKPSGPLWEASLKAKQKFLEGERVEELSNSMFYHTDYIKAPYWTKNMKKVSKIGQHIFY